MDSAVSGVQMAMREQTMRAAALSAAMLFERGNGEVTQTSQESVNGTLYFRGTN